MEDLDPNTVDWGALGDPDEEPREMFNGYLGQTMSMRPSAFRQFASMRSDDGPAAPTRSAQATTPSAVSVPMRITTGKRFRLLQRTVSLTLARKIVADIMQSSDRGPFAVGVSQLNRSFAQMSTGDVGLRRLTSQELVRVLRDAGLQAAEFRPQLVLPEGAMNFPTAPGGDGVSLRSRTDAPVLVSGSGDPGQVLVPGVGVQFFFHTDQSLKF